jgi:hypothetical protein
VQSVEVKVDASLIEQLRAGYVEMAKPALARDCASAAAQHGENGVRPAVFRGPPACP